MAIERAFVTGSSGLVGSETVRFLCDKGWEVLGIDNDARRMMFGPQASTALMGTELSLKYPRQFRQVNDCDIRNEDWLKHHMQGNGKFDLIVHAAAAPAHEWSTDHALADFGINAKGTMNMLESYRQTQPQAKFIHVSTSKVYGDSVNELPLEEQETRFDLPQDHQYYEGVDEEFGRLDGNLHSLFGASKACGDIMAQEYGKYFDLPITIFRPVCITGPAHKGAKLHGYLSYLVKCIAEGEPYTINGYKGKQVRDNIHAKDLVAAFWEVYKDPSPTSGETYNIGGGRESNNSILEAVQQAEQLLDKKANIGYSEETRRGDHLWCIYSSDKFRARYPQWQLSYNNDRIMEELCDSYIKEKAA